MSHTEDVQQKQSNEPPFYMTEGERNFGGGGGRGANRGRHFKPGMRARRRRRAWAIVFVVVALVAGALGASPELRANVVALGKMDHPQGQSGVWRLAFSDEFNGGGLDSSKWNPCYPSNDPSATSSGGCSNGPEQQWYQSQNVSVSDGLLHLTAKKESSNGFNYTSGMVTTGPVAKHAGQDNRFAFKYGYVEARVKVPKGQGLWPAAWLLPSDGSGPPEIDLIEVLGNDTKTAYATVHWSLDQASKSMSTVQGTDFASDFHTVGVRWSEDAIDWYYDGVRVKRFVDKDQIPHMRMFVLLNLAVGGAWPGSPNATTQFPADYQVDWVRVWKPITG